MIQAHQLTKRYGDKTAVHTLSFTIAPGTVTGFLGPNGAGKSTTMRLIMGLDRPTSGTVTVNGKPYGQHRSPGAQGHRQARDRRRRGAGARSRGRCGTGSVASDDRPALPHSTGLRAPRAQESRFSMDVAGVVEAVGKNVSRFEVGDEVFGIGKGTFAEHARAPEHKLAPKPASLTFEQAAVLAISGLTALQGLRDHGRVEAGRKVLIIGASGGVGTYAVQIARAFGAHVTGVCSTRKVEMVRSIDADPTWAGAINTVLVTQGVKVSELCRPQKDMTLAGARFQQGELMKMR